MKKNENLSYERANIELFVPNTTSHLRKKKQFNRYHILNTVIWMVMMVLMKAAS